MKVSCRARWQAAHAARPPSPPQIDAPDGDTRSEGLPFTSLLYPLSRGERRRKEQLLAFNFEPRVLQESPAVGFARRKDVSAGVGEGLDDDDGGDEDSLVTP